MGTKRKQTPPPPLTEKDIAHLNWVERNSTLLARSALKLYDKSGRGAFIIREQDAKPSATTARYQTVVNALTNGIGWPDEKAAHLVRSYEPTQQFVIIFIYRNGAASSYTIHFAQT
jgi:hypothetical protein